MNRQKPFILKQGTKYEVRSINYFLDIIEYWGEQRVLQTCKFIDVEGIWYQEMMM